MYSKTNPYEEHKNQASETSEHIQQEKRVKNVTKQMLQNYLYYFIPFK